MYMCACSLYPQLASALATAVTYLLSLIAGREAGAAAIVLSPPLRRQRCQWHTRCPLVGLASSVGLKELVNAVGKVAQDAGCALELFVQNHAGLPIHCPPQVMRELEGILHANPCPSETKHPHQVALLSWAASSVAACQCSVKVLQTAADKCEQLRHEHVHYPSASCAAHLDGHEVALIANAARPLLLRLGQEPPVRTLTTAVL